MSYKPRPHSAAPELTSKERAAKQATRNFDIGLPVVAGRGDGRKGRDHGGVELLKNVSGETALETLANSIDSALDPSKASSKPVVTQHSVPKSRSSRSIRYQRAGRHAAFGTKEPVVTQHSVPKSRSSRSIRYQRKLCITRTTSTITIEPFITIEPLSTGPRKL